MRDTDIHHKIKHLRAKVEQWKNSFTTADQRITMLERERDKYKKQFNRVTVERDKAKDLAVYWKGVHTAACKRESDALGMATALHVEVERLSTALSDVNAEHLTLETEHRVEVETLRYALDYIEWESKEKKECVEIVANALKAVGMHHDRLAARAVLGKGKTL